ncbi:MAG TPA: DUF4249 domain-containing protein [Puia sp.]|nr:DUF4249 domain-containing protein [Puia sp.]
MIFFSFYSCRKSYAPPEVNANHKFLSVDGLINTGPNNFSTFKLTRSQDLSDTVPSIPERGATVTIKDGTGASYPLTDTGSNGIYVSTELSLNPTQEYTLSVVTADGNQYASNPVKSKQPPPIDSLNWTLGFDGAANTQAINIFVNTHDPTNRTRFYRWDFIETWAHESLYRTFYLIQNKRIVYVSDSNQHPWHCWTNAPSTNILLGSSGGLSADVISQSLITKIYQNDPRLDIKYSILVKQYAIDSSAYDYWKLVQNQSESLGGLFDIQPAQLMGNIRNLKVPAEPVYGFVSASGVQQQRIFISNQDLPGWKSVTTQECKEDIFTPQPLQGQDLFGYYNIDPNFTFLRFDIDSNGIPVQILITPACIDCTFQGGSNIKPPFWQ